MQDLAQFRHLSLLGPKIFKCVDIRRDELMGRVHGGSNCRARSHLTFLFKSSGFVQGRAEVSFWVVARTRPPVNKKPKIGHRACSYSWTHCESSAIWLGVNSEKSSNPAWRCP